MKQPEIKHVEVRQDLMDKAIELIMVKKFSHVVGEREVHMLRLALQLHPDIVIEDLLLMVSA